MGGELPAAAAPSSFCFHELLQAQLDHEADDLATLELGDFAQLGVGQGAAFQCIQDAAFGVLVGKPAVNVVGEGLSKLLIGGGGEAVVATAASRAAGFDEALLVGQTGEMLTRSLEGALAELGGLASGDFAVTGEEVDDEEVVHVQAGMGVNEFEELAAGVLAFDGDDDGLAGGGVIRRLLAFAEEFAENAGNAEKGCTKQAKLSGGYVTTEGGEMQLEFTGTPADALPVKDFLVPQLNAARERDVQATFILTFSPGLPLAGDAAEKLGERLAKFASGAAYVSATAEATA